MPLAESRLRALQVNLDTIRQRMSAAAQRAGRAPSDVALLAVTKYVGPIEVEALAALGVGLFGENRVQEASAKGSRRNGIAWHLIGHLQRNKARKAVALFDVIETVDSLRLARALDDEAGRTGRRLPVLLEANISGEGSKTGLPLEEIDEAYREMARMKNLDLRGVMGMAPPVRDAEEARPAFRMAREVRERGRGISGLPLPELSIGMSQDFEVAIEEGATIVRIGRALYEGVI